ncbi:F-box domain-containing protein [Mycena sanguinolenta]|uniref:F-box domain-containing protein n=1 Tax=Mycena sanguinolenta TaxID=230812 RepID=A0A8H6YNE2_9AGAR|nr:F-box domain-containing protein [Mycena sanguinolenta]
MSVEQLRARIAKLDTEIELQKELLKKLEHDKILARRQLNSVLDPVARLPLEISSEIFLQSLEPFPMLGVRRVPGPMLLLNICHAWTKIALSTPALWATIYMGLPCGIGLKEILPIWLERACNRPLSISLEGIEAEKVDEEVAAIIRRHGHQLKHLELFVEPKEDELDGSILGPLSSLETLTIRCPEQWVLTRHCVLELLRLAPNLVELIVESNFSFPDDVIEEVVLPKLRRFWFGDPGECPIWKDYLLECLSLPKLEVLSIATSSDELFPFLKDSSPPLLELVLRFRDGAIDFATLAEYVPHLMQFELWYPQYWAVEDLFGVLTKSQSPLAHLRTLVVHIDNFELFELFGHCDAFWTAMIHALIARRTQLQVFRLIVSSRLRDSDMPAPDILAAIRELVTDGMQVSIGQDKRDGQWTLFD